ncbi:helix-turn-helix domain-containing protein [Streptococcus porcorum]|uniref:Transcriptional regulator with XRE-family HTH domain n=1 Tax=Streptococcus porcorum TaxID=701526 RepID=A0ABV2JHC8_9STRE
MNKDLQTYIAKRIRLNRKRQGISQEALSESAGLGTKAVQHIEGQKYDFKITTLEKVILALNMTYHDFFDFPSNDTEESLAELIDNIRSLPKEKQASIIQSFNDITKNMK